jgi:hypothetical protein
MRSAAKSETSGVFNNGQAAIICRTSLHALGHPQPPTPLKTDNTTASSFVHANICQRRSKTWDISAAIPQNNIFISTGIEAKTIGPTILQYIIPQRIIFRCERNMFEMLT